MNVSDQALEIAIVGAGIAGLAAAISLRRAGHLVTVYERSLQKNEVGAAIMMTPHAVRILRTWGIAEPEPTKGEQYTDVAYGKKVHGSMGRDPKTTETIMINSHEGDEQAYGARGIAYHRADLHSALRRVAVDAGARIVLGQTAVGIDCAAGTATLVDSSSKTVKQTIYANLIVLADGVNTSFAQAVTHQDIPLQKLGISVYRMLIPLQDLLSDPDTAILFDHQGQNFSARTFSPATGVFIITYPCRSGEIMNVAIFHQPEPGKMEQLDWNTPASVIDAESALDGFNPAFKAMLRHAHQDVKVYSLVDRAPLPTYVNGRVALIGDAAHPMLPTVAGGGTTSLEDAAALEVLLRGLSASDPDEKFAQRLALFDAVCRPRDSMTQILSKSLLKPVPASSLADQVRSFYIGHLPDDIIAGSSKPTREFIYPYDVYAVAEAALAWAEGAGFPPDMMLQMQREGVIKHFGR